MKPDTIKIEIYSYDFEEVERLLILNGISYHPTPAEPFIGPVPDLIKLLDD